MELQEINRRICVLEKNLGNKSIPENMRKEIPSKIKELEKMRDGASSSSVAKADEIIAMASKKKIIRNPKVPTIKKERKTKDPIVAISGKSVLSKYSDKVKDFNKGRSEASIKEDAGRQALPPGKRISKKGNVYYEYRPDHSDIDPTVGLESGGKIKKNMAKQKTSAAMDNVAKIIEEARAKMSEAKKEGVSGKDNLFNQKKGLAKANNSLVVICSSEGNPDYGQYSPLSPKATYPVDTLKKASEICMQYIERYDLGGGNWTGGKVYDIDGKQVASISYNGRVWKTDNHKDGEITGDDLIKKYYAKGGEIILAETFSGKPIYNEASHEGHNDFSFKEHREAALAHQKMMDKYAENMDKANWQKHREQRELHKEMANKKLPENRFVGGYYKHGGKTNKANEDDSFQSGDKVKKRTTGEKAEVVRCNHNGSKEHESYVVKKEDGKEGYWWASDMQICYECGGRAYASGGEIEETLDNKDLVAQKAIEITTHAREFKELLEGKETVPAWLVARMARSATDISDVADFLNDEERMDENEVIEDEPLAEETPIEEVKEEEVPAEEEGNYEFDGMKKGGNVTFSDKTKAVAKSLTGKEVPVKYRQEYGKVYTKEEAEIAADRIIGSMSVKRKKLKEELAKQNDDPKFKATAKKYNAQINKHIKDLQSK